MPRSDEVFEELPFVERNDDMAEMVNHRMASYDDDEDEEGYGLPSDDGDSLWDNAEDSDDDEDEEDSSAAPWHVAVLDVRPRTRVHPDPHRARLQSPSPWLKTRQTKQKNRPRRRLR
jgi:hypothetical protein